MTRKTDSRLREAQDKIADLKDKVATFTAANAKSPRNAELHSQVARTKRSLEAAEQELVDLKAQIARETFDERIANLQGDVTLLEESMSDVALAMAESPEDTALEEQLADIRRERDSRVQAIENLHLARQAASRRDVEADAAAKARELAELRERHEAAWQRTIQNAVQLVDHLSAAGPQWMSTLAALAEANSTGNAMIKLANGPKVCQRVFGTPRADGHSQLAVAVMSALASTRIGTDGPSIPHVTIPSIGPKDIVSASDLERRLRQSFEMQREGGIPKLSDESRGPRLVSPQNVDEGFVRPSGARGGHAQWPMVPTGHLVAADEQGHRLVTKPVV